MGESCFRITLNLSNFFHDHRTMCKIFINKKMKCIKDLEYHISEIFNLNNFYLISQNHYLPSTEDIRILQHDDLLFAMPCQWNDNIIHTSTPLRKHRHAVEKDEKSDINSSTSFPKKRKKEKINFDLKQNKKRKVDDNIQNDRKENEDDAQNNIVKAGKKKKKLKQQSIFSEDQNLTIEEYVDKAVISVKEKALHFEKQSSVDELRSNEIIRKSAINVSKLQLKHEEANKREKHDSMKIDSTAQSVNKQISDANLYRHKKLLIQKRNTDIISFDLPKNSNIVKSILVASKPSNATHSTEETFKARNTESISENSRNADNSTQKDITEDYKEDLALKIGETNEHLKYTNIYLPSTSLLQKVETDCFEDNTENSSTSIAKNIASIQNTEIITENTISKSISTGNNTTRSNICQNNSINTKAFIVEDTFQLPKNRKSSQINEMLRDSSLTRCTKHEESDSIVSIKSSISGKDSCSDNTIEICSDTFTNNVEDAGFITKRKRKRSHRKRKSKPSVDSNPVPIQVEERILQPSISTGIHTKFNDNGDPISNHQSIKENSQCTMNLLDNLNVCDEHFKTETALQTKSLQQNVSEHVEVNDIAKDRNSTANSAIISEDTILKSPIMTSIKPKLGDLIAFQILKLTESYTPIVSQYIIGEILSIEQSTSNVDIKIIDGIDQCAEPEGKFSMEDTSEPEESTNIRTFSWGSLMCPRLIFP